MNQHKAHCQMSSLGWAASVPPRCTCDEQPKTAAGHSVPYTPDWEKEFDKKFTATGQPFTLTMVAEIQDFIRSLLQAREEWLLKSVSDLLEKTELKCDSQVYEQCSFCKLKYDLFQLLTPKN